MINAILTLKKALKASVMISGAHYFSLIWKETMKNYNRCLIVGAGISGLYTALSLIEKKLYLGNEITIIDKYAAPGGRLRARCLESGDILNMGAGRFCVKDHPLLTNLLKQLKLDTKPHKIAKQKGKNDAFQKKYLAVLEKSKAYKNELHSISFPAFVIKYFGLCFFNELREESGYDTLGQASLPLSEGLRIIHQHPESDEAEANSWFEPVRGFISIADKLLVKLVQMGVNVKADCELVSVLRCAQHTIVNFKQRYGLQTQLYERVIFACGKEAIHSIQHPYINMRQLFDAIQTVPLFKCFMRFETAWWKSFLKEKSQDSKCLLVSGSSLRKVYFDTDNRLLWIYNDDVAAQHWGALHQEDERESLQLQLLEELAHSLKMDANHIPAPEEMRSIYWPQGVSFWRIGFDPKSLNEFALFGIDTHVHVVTDMFSTRSGWIEGALANVEHFVDKLSHQFPSIVGKESKDESIIIPMQTHRLKQPHSV